MYVKAVGGEVPATSSLAPKIGPLGLVSWSSFTKINTERIPRFLAEAVMHVHYPGDSMI